ncbi:MAG: phosphate transporter permease protein [Actinomycetota bacterium]|jgi:phosphate transport system permease protein
MAAVTPRAPAAATPTDLRAALERRERNVPGIALQGFLVLAVLTTLLILTTLLVRLVGPAIPVFRQRGVGFLTSTIGSNPDKVGIWPGLYGSFFIGLGVVLVSIPLGVFAAIFLEEYAHDTRFNRFIVVNIRNLAGVPAVIYGVLGLTIFVGWLKPVTNGQTVIAAALTLAVLVLPIVIITASESIRAVPQGLRDAGYGVGASKWEVTRDHVLPYAAPGILTGSMLSLARALGEAAPLILIGAITGLLPKVSLTDSFTALPMTIYSWSAKADPPGSTLGFENVAAAAGVVLLALVLVFNIVAVVLRTRFEKRRTGT